jgi:hypothetical protein
MTEVRKDGMIKFKTLKLKEEFYDLAQTDPRIRAVAGELALWVGKLFEKHLVVTCVWRAEEEQRKIYGEVKPSAHFCNPQCRAVDIRGHYDYFSTHELTNIESFVRKYFPRGDGIPAVRIHGEGDDHHIHLSVEPLGDLSHLEKTKKEE